MKRILNFKISSGLGILIILAAASVLLAVLYSETTALNGSLRELELTAAQIY